MSAEARAADKRQSIHVVNVRSSRSSGQKSEDQSSKCPQQQKQRTKVNRSKQ
ncbi:hypothetical protein [Bacillus alkalicola]|uniref:Uncharacterized protein n=1 Tax=Evansella alkalicola TaxID=745819 RepID=A0ABS6K0F8_9BACI|nr:hypothetical protein [Bacillus alkalicola]MBU9724341.1 hypothetical protein [Bacillus alkalicola]